jgi:hypothetical protein
VLKNLPSQITKVDDFLKSNEKDKALILPEFPFSLTQWIIRRQ